MMEALLGEQLPAEECTKVLAMLDESGDGEVSLKEFKACREAGERERGGEGEGRRDGGTEGVPATSHISAW